MKNSFILLFSFLTLLAQGQTKKLVWAEEFDKNGLPDESTWNFEQGKAQYNNEPQYHTKELKNVRVENGKLIITTLLEEVDGVKRYISQDQYEGQEGIYKWPH